LVSSWDRITVDDGDDDNYDDDNHDNNNKDEDDDQDDGDYDDDDNMMMSQPHIILVTCTHSFYRGEDRFIFLLYWPLHVLVM